MTVLRRLTVASLTVVVIVVVLIFVSIHLVGRWFQAHDFGLVPVAVFSASDSGNVSLDETVLAVVPNQRVDLIPRLNAAIDMGILYDRRLTAGHCALLAGEGQVIIAWHIVPLTTLVPDHHHAVLAHGEEAVRLTHSPVLKLHRVSICPAEIIVKHFIIQSNPLIVMPQTINKELLFMGQDTGEVTALQTTRSFRCFPCPPVCEVLIAVALKLVPAKVTNLRVLLTEGS